MPSRNSIQISRIDVQLVRVSLGSRHKAFCTKVTNSVALVATCISSWASVPRWMSVIITLGALLVLRSIPATTKSASTLTSLWKFDHFHKDGFTLGTFLQCLHLSTPESFDFKRPDGWTKWKRRFEQFRHASNLALEGDLRQVSTLLYCMG